MNKKQAESKGYRFTGVYESDKEKVIARRDELKQKGYKAIVVTVPPNKLSRGFHGDGYSLYAEQRYFNDEEIVTLKQRLSQIGDRKARALKSYQADIALIEDDEQRWQNELTKLTDFLE